MFPAAVPAWMCAMWRSYSLLVTWPHFLSPGEPSYVRTLQLIPRLYILRRTVKVAQEREGKLKLEEFY